VTQREFPAQPLVGVGGVVLDAEGRVLLVRRGTAPLLGRWSLPGGLLELGETLAEGVKREVLEETGLNVLPEAIVDVIDRIYRYNEEGMSDEKQSRIQFHYVVVDYWCRVLSGDLKPASDAAEVAWVTRAEWKDSNIYSLEEVAVQVIGKSWLMALEAGICSGKTISSD
jgi:8-oxo-dGTP diphosphatase